MAKEHFLDQHDPDRKEFQIDRIVLFSDAVFAIAITLLIIEVKAPVVIPGYGTSQMLEQLSEVSGKFFGFLLSFFVIAIYWRSHHRIFGFVKNYNDKLIWLNFYFLFTIVLMPFSSAYYGENGGYSIPFYFYNGNIIIASLVSYRLISYIFNPKNNIVSHSPDPIFKKLFIARGFSISAIFLFAILLSLVKGPWFFIASRFCPILIWPVFAILKKIYHKRASRYNRADTKELLADEEESHLS